MSGTCLPSSPAWLTITVPGTPVAHQSVAPDDQGALRVTAPTDPGTTYRLDCTTPAGDVVSLGAIAG